VRTPASQPQETSHDPLLADGEIGDAGEVLMLQPILPFNGEPARRLS